jgi:hypothetical protein
MMLSPASGLHQMQQLLQQQILSPAQLQSLMQQHSLVLQQQQPHHHQPVSVTFASYILLHQNAATFSLEESDHYVRYRSFGTC